MVALASSTAGRCSRWRRRRLRPIALAAAAADRVGGRHDPRDGATYARLARQAAPEHARPPRGSRISPRGGGPRPGPDRHV